MSSSALFAAHKSLNRKLLELNSTCAHAFHDWTDPMGTIAFANEIDDRIQALVTGINLLRHEATRVLEARKHQPSK